MTRLALAAVALLACAPAAGPAAPEARYGFVARLGRDTVAVERVARRADTVTSDEVDRFPLVRRRHTRVELGPDGGIRRLVMDISTPSDSAEHRERHVVAEVTADSVRVTRRDGAGTTVRAFATGGGTVMAHVPQMYSLYELYFAAAARRVAARGTGDTAQLRQFYVDREFDRFPLHRGTVRLLSGGRAEVAHDWLSGVGEATLDSAGRLLHYSGARTTYGVDVRREAAAPDVGPVAARFAALEARSGARALSVRDTVRARIGDAAFTVDYSRPLARGRVLLGGVVPYDRVWRTGANAATQFTTSVPVTLAGLTVPAGTYTLWTLPHARGVELIVNRQTGQWGTGYGPAHDLGRAPMTSEAPAAPAEQMTIAIEPDGPQRGTLAIAWGPFRWTAPIAVR